MFHGLESARREKGEKFWWMVGQTKIFFLSLFPFNLFLFFLIFSIPSSISCFSFYFFQFFLLFLPFSFPSFSTPLICSVFHISCFFLVCFSSFYFDCINLVYCTKEMILISKLMKWNKIINIYTHILHTFSSINFYNILVKRIHPPLWNVWCWTCLKFAMSIFEDCYRENILSR